MSHRSTTPGATPDAPRHPCSRPVQALLERVTATQLAEVITGGCLDRNPGFQRIDNRGCPTMLAGYRVLTGADPINHAITC